MKNLQQIMKQAQKMQEQLQKQMAELSVEGSSGGGMVTIRMNGLKQVLAVKIEPDAVTSGDVEMLQDLIVAAFNEAARKVDEEMSGQMGGLTGGLKIPGLF
jgi:nucleoid-associated protein EbfC